MVHALLRVMDNETDCPKPVNLGNPDEMTVLELLEHIIALTKTNARVTHLPLPVHDLVAAVPTSHGQGRSWAGNLKLICVQAWSVPAAGLGAKLPVCRKVTAM